MGTDLKKATSFRTNWTDRDSTADALTGQWYLKGSMPAPAPYYFRPTTAYPVMSFNPYAEVDRISPPLAFHPLLSPNRSTKEQDGYRSQTLDPNVYPTLQYRSTTKPVQAIGYYPASLCLLTIWIAYIVVLLWLLETAVKQGPKNLVQPWSYATLPNLLITVFAQGHGAITAMHLSRVSVSALHSPRTSPNTWAEVFWISDRAWQGPVGIASTFLAATRLRVRTSTHFIFCAVTCLTALITPIILSRAYPVQTITVNEDTIITPFALSVQQMGAVDAYAEMGTGSGSWTTALSVADTYNSSVFLPPAASREGDPTDFFFAGNVEGKTARLPGLRLSGQCVSVPTPISSFDDFETYCVAQIPSSQLTINHPITITPDPVNLTLGTCCNSTWQAVLLPNESVATTIGYIYLQSNNGSTMPSGTSVDGLIRCDARFATGRATLSGTKGSFTNFAEEPLYNETQQGEPLFDPLFAMLSYFNSGLFQNDQLKAGVARALGYVGLSDDQGSQLYTQPGLDEMATGFWRGISYHVAAVGLLSRANDTSYPAVQSSLSAVHVREWRFAVGAYALFALWLLLLVLLTARSFRPTFAGGFDSYLTAKLVQHNPGLVEESCGGLATNEIAKESFGTVRSDENGRIVVR
ncbi:hypothetical protein R3P38DRAFT_538780 [Favolaschia claudopus]|uniref:Uncharacterized protein n=1 Tax=Favolaschia claudopus TaxID=2862362 RepID=A0AAW0CIL8_9AGAR